jgi:AcrR family transcriptional regulator
MPGKAREPLTRERVVAEAIALADSEGIEALTMRKLGRSLGVEAMSLYNHVPNKGQLVAAMVESVIREFELPDDEPRWDVAIRRLAISAHRVLNEHRWACRLALLPGDPRTLDGPRVRYMEWLLRRLREAGFSPGLAYSAYHTIDSHIFGFTLWQIGHADAARAMSPPDGEDVEEWALRMIAAMEPRLPYLAEHGEMHVARGHDGDAEYEFGLDLILEGLKKRLRAR